jgi:hypothetical protein
VAGDLSGMLDAYLTASAQRHWLERRAQIRATGFGRAQFERAQAYIREYCDGVDNFPPRRLSCADSAGPPYITGSLERDGYRIREAYLRRHAGFFSVTANIYVPAKGPRAFFVLSFAFFPFPAVLGTAVAHSDDGKAADLISTRLDRDGSAAA